MTRAKAYETFCYGSLIALAIVIAFVTVYIMGAWING